MNRYHKPRFSIWRERGFVSMGNRTIKMEVQKDVHLGIITYGDTREEVMSEFSNEFATLWDVIAGEEDSLLTEDARLLKRRLTELVRKVAPHGDTQGKGDQGRAD